MRDIDGLVAWVTGAGTGIGAAAAVALAARGVKVVLSGRRAAPLEETAALIQAAGGAAMVLVVDVVDRAAVGAALYVVFRGHIYRNTNTGGSFDHD
ncbi:MAG: SDR family NAD(P)-dependent oxidoreductase, partial [Thalassobaculaceae bacterium]